MTNHDNAYGEQENRVDEPAALSAQQAGRGGPEPVARQAPVDSSRLSRQQRYDYLWLIFSLIALVCLAIFVLSIA